MKEDVQAAARLVFMQVGRQMGESAPGVRACGRAVGGWQVPEHAIELARVSLLHHPITQTSLS